MQLVEFCHLLFLEVLDLFLSFLEFCINSFLFTFHALLLVLQVADIELDGFLSVIQVQTRVTKTLN